MISESDSRAFWQHLRADCKDDNGCYRRSSELVAATRAGDFDKYFSLLPANMPIGLRYVVWRLYAWQWQAKKWKARESFFWREMSGAKRGEWQ